MIESSIFTLRSGLLSKLPNCGILVNIMSRLEKPTYEFYQTSSIFICPRKDQSGHKSINLRFRIIYCWYDNKQKDNQRSIIL
ncbi:uncharacterized protein OCT59_017267 [Rhizophagus irregularis]|uniref:uncharacterized protein n=1 Tax=Rhizophagus irregularis TaxID=588596 RepID=UPI001A1075DB|nr:hypothetical protein OCT59_017267 [Rhizophagus irregularis]GBC50219.2 hypothetical protein RIR_jg21635.t1 [Rhizophagus irregularis DAOM 181602=DAOM 197198]